MLFPPGILLILLLGSAISLQVPIKNATSRTVFKSKLHFMESNALDGNTNTFYHSGIDDQPEWLNLTINSGYRVLKVVVVNRLV